MATLEEKVEAAIIQINALHDSVSKTNWATLNRSGFSFELEQNTNHAKSLYKNLSEINKETNMLLEKGAPNMDSFLSEFIHELTVLESNVSFEKKKKMREEIVNEREPIEVPELYSSLQQKILSISLKARYNTDRFRNFMLARKTPFVKKGTTAKNLIEILQTKETELVELKQKNVELKRKTFFGSGEEKNIAEIEAELNEMDKKLSETVSETKKSLKSHFAQINYVEGSFVQLKNRVEEIENTHSAFAKHAVELIKELKKERDFAKTLALELEGETVQKRNEYLKQILEFEEKKQAIEEKMKDRFEKEILSLRKQLVEKETSLKNLQKLVEKLENEVKKK